MRADDLDRVPFRDPVIGVDIEPSGPVASIAA
jgi:hypothetical protein